MVNDGFLYVKNHAVPQDAINDMVKMTKQFFRTPICERLRFKAECKLIDKWSPGGHAFEYELPYNIIEEENFTNKGTTVKMKSANIAPVAHQSQILIDPESKLDTVKICNIIRRYTREITALGKRLVFWFEVVLGIPKNSPVKFMGDGGGSAICYGHTPKGKDGLAAHFDNHFITILMQTEPGLEARHKNKWYPVNPVPGTFVVNFGNIMEYLTCGVIKATFHRSRNDWTNGYRFSWPIFIPVAKREKRMDSKDNQIVPELKWNMAELIALRKSFGQPDAKKREEDEKANGGIRSRRGLERNFNFLDFEWHFK